MFNLLPTEAKRQMDTFHTQWEILNTNIIRSARQHNISCPIERIFRAVDHEGDMTMAEFLQTLDEILFTNIDITANVLVFMLTNLATHRPFQESLHAEIMQERNRPSYDIAQYIGRQDTLLHYLGMECVRLRPAFWFSLPECTAVEKIIGKYRIPAQTPAVIDVRRLNSNPITWGSDGDVFRPERFAGLSSAQYRYGFMRFGVGSGKCMGKHMADVLLKMTAVAVLERYEIGPVVVGGEVKDGEITFAKR
ncbi:hypothetical protein ABVK25_012118 [Lepraria finkii]|uniref:Cytochrome P450 n=1 Tax=Lepraria finkii TaxID=1340010 RepID=A0ABR4AKR8_9LECA